ncbi:MAG: acetamidase/formamidase family protein [Bacillota bacterium]|nr:acetamidase/formamidase family protein [Bacillota bacterium]
MLIISCNHVTGSLAPDNKPVAYCESGETIKFETRDCYDDRLMADGTLLDPQNTLSNPATGPLYVGGAHPGDILKVEIQEIALKSTGIMQALPGAGAFGEMLPREHVQEFTIADEGISFGESLKLPLRPMIGVIGTAPEESSISTHIPGNHGGNMDCTRVTQGSALYLPVNVPGALLSMGDLHAVMGDGEVLICGMETGGTVTVKVTVLNDVSLPVPCLVSDDIFCTIQSATDLDHASCDASKVMLRFIQERTGMDTASCGMLLSLAGNLIICQIVNPQKTVRMELSTEILQSLGVELP